jgi:hypothetical protein
MVKYGMLAQTIQATPEATLGWVATAGGINPATAISNQLQKEDKSWQERF